MLWKGCYNLKLLAGLNSPYGTQNNDIYIMIFSFVRPRGIPCFPLETMLLAMNRTRLDYLSLDVEGLEMEVIRTIPFDRIDIRVISVEHKHVPGGKEALRKYIEKQV